MSGYKDIHGRKKRRVPWTVIVVVLGVIVFVLLFMWFRGGEEEIAPEFEVFEEPAPVIEETEPEEEVVIDKPLEEIKLLAVSTTPASGIARRSIKDGIYKHSVKAELSEPPPLVIGQNDSKQEIERYYEGWLVSRNPFTFFSTGELVTNSDGDYVLEWTGQAGQTYANYNEVVITIEPRDDDPAPADHILEGEFK